MTFKEQLKGAIQLPTNNRFDSNATTGKFVKKEHLVPANLSICQGPSWRLPTRVEAQTPMRQFQKSHFLASANFVTFCLLASPHKVGKVEWRGLVDKIPLKKKKIYFGPKYSRPSCWCRFDAKTIQTLYAIIRMHMQTKLSTGHEKNIKEEIWWYRIGQVFLPATQGQSKETAAIEKCLKMHRMRPCVSALKRGSVADCVILRSLLH